MFYGIRLSDWSPADMIPYKQMVKGLKDGELVLVAEPDNCRKFYTDLSNSQRGKMVGDAQCYESKIVKLFYLCAPFPLIIAIISSFFAFGWWAVLFIFGLVLFYSVSKPVTFNLSFIPSILLIGTACFFVFYFRHLGTAFILAVIMAPLTRLFLTLTYRLSLLFFTHLLETTPKAYESLANNTEDFDFPPLRVQNVKTGNFFE